MKMYISGHSRPDSKSVGTTQWLLGFKNVVQRKLVPKFNNLKHPIFIISHIDFPMLYIANMGFLNIQKSHIDVNI